MYKNKFTLIELLAVIAIIGVLFTLVLTTGPKIIAIAKLRTCSNNIRQLCLASTAYANQDSKGRMPGPCPRARYEDNHGNVSGGNTVTSWDKALAKELGIENRPRNYYQIDVIRDFGAESGKMTYYSKALNVFTCPIDPKFAETENAEGIVRSYLLNIGDNEINKEGDAIYSGRIVNPSDTALFVESHYSGENVDGKYFGSRNGEGITYITVHGVDRLYKDDETEYYMHGSNGNSSFNIGCFDGSTKTITTKELKENNCKILKYKK